LKLIEAKMHQVTNWLQVTTNSLLCLPSKFPICDSINTPKSKMWLYSLISTEVCYHGFGRYWNVNYTNIEKRIWELGLEEFFTELKMLTIISIQLRKLSHPCWSTFTHSQSSSLKFCKGNNQSKSVKSRDWI
jgi:hypothetical protein